MKRKITGPITKTVRFACLKALYRIEKGGSYSNLLVREFIETSQLSKVDAALFTEIVYGSIAYKYLLAYYLEPFTRKAKKIDDWVQLLLEMSVYQLFFLDKVPSHAILNEAVELAKAFGNPGIAKFVNGVLRNVQRQGKRDLNLMKDPIQRLSVEISMPKWLVEKLVSILGIEETRKLGQSLFLPSHASARVNRKFLSRQEAISRLKQEGIQAKLSQVAEDGIIAEKGFLAGSTLYQEGLLTIQDESSMLVAPILAPKEDDYVLDACAAPGGKTTHIASFLDSTKSGKILALDIHAHKIRLIEQNAKRLGVEKVVITKQLDARKIKETYPAETFDRILVDAPCSGLGLMRRKPDIKYQKKPEDFKQLPKIQLEILESAASVLKSNGRLVYSTCTIVPEENQAIIKQFLSKHPDFELVPIKVADYLAESLEEGMITIYPHQYHTDGFFISCLRKK